MHVPAKSRPAFALILSVCCHITIGEWWNVMTFFYSVSPKAYFVQARRTSSEASLYRASLWFVIYTWMVSGTIWHLWEHATHHIMITRQGLIKAISRNLSLLWIVAVQTTQEEPSHFTIQQSFGYYHSSPPPLQRHRYRSYIKFVQMARACGPSSLEHSSFVHAACIGACLHLSIN